MWRCGIEVTRRFTLGCAFPPQSNLRQDYNGHKSLNRNYLCHVMKIHLNNRWQPMNCPTPYGHKFTNSRINRQDATGISKKNFNIPTCGRVECTTTKRVINFHKNDSGISSLGNVISKWNWNRNWMMYELPNHVTQWYTVLHTADDADNKDSYTHHRLLSEGYL